MQITNKELAVLGLLSEAPKYGYQIEQDIESRGMREWTAIGFSSIYYILNKLELKSYLSSEIHPEEGRPARKIYQLTGQGQKVFRAAVYERLSNPRPYSGDLDLGLANMPALHPNEIIKALKTCRSRLAERIIQLKDKWEEDSQPNLPSHVHALFDHSTSQMQAELDWLEGYIRQLENKLLD